MNTIFLLLSVPAKCDMSMFMYVHVYIRTVCVCARMCAVECVWECICVQARGQTHCHSSSAVYLMVFGLVCFGFYLCLGGFHYVGQAGLEQAM